MIDTTHTRAALLRQIGQVFRERGYEGATLTQLAAATGLGKASLYHHFPGGKAEMVEVLVRDAMAEAQRRAFSRLEGRAPPNERLQDFLSGFEDYLEQAGGQCLLAVLVLGSARGTHGAQVSEQFGDWQASLARVYQDAGQKPKRASRAAADLLNQLYGAQMVARLLDQPRHLRRTFKRLGRSLSGDAPRG